MGRSGEATPRRRMARRLGGLVVLAALVGTPMSAPRGEEALAGAITRFATDAAGLVDRTGVTAYTTESLGWGPKGEPDMRLALRRPKAFTDCSGWVAYLLAVVSPLHEAVLARHRLAAVFNEGVLDEAAFPWPRAFVVRDYLARQPVEGSAAVGGFRQIADFRRLAPGDVVAWCLGVWCRPRTMTREPDGATGHVFVVVGHPKPISPTVRDYLGVVDGVATLGKVPGRRVTGVVELSVVDSSSDPHFHDTRDFERVPPAAPAESIPGGLGSGRIWIAHDATGAPVQFRFSRAAPYLPNPARPGTVEFGAGRPLPAMNLRGELVVTRYGNVVDELAGQRYTTAPVRLEGRGALEIRAGAPLALAAPSSFRGTIRIGLGAALSAASDAALGEAGNPVHLLGRLTLADGFAGAADRRLIAEPSGVLATAGDATWREPLSGRSLTVDAAGRLTLSALGRTVHGRRTLRLP